MLKSLEIVGFKSFADKTRLEFPPGITVVVGPNGSGKSNVVDAIKWVLGEQSAKSLRGREMADVIFNGSDSRRAMGSAEITLTLDNRDGMLAVDTPEVHLTRRIYRSGEGEYLINRNPCRLRDIRELLFGTGMGTQAYSVIEQGKVDRLLQASPHDRRVIFEEAAGISRFKAKRAESQRRLARVDQNLLRLSDIVDEVESRLRSVRSQAGRATRYKEYSDRLQSLRTEAALVDWHRLTEEWADISAELQAMISQRDEYLAEIEAAENEAVELRDRIARQDEEIRTNESTVTTNRERIAGAESTIAHEHARCGDLEESLARQRCTLLELRTRAGDLRQQLDEATGRAEDARRRHDEIALKLGDIQRQLSDTLSRIDVLRESIDQQQFTRELTSNQIARASAEVTSLEKEIEAAGAVSRNIAGRVEGIQGRIAEATERLKHWRAEQQTLETAAGLREDEVTAARLDQEQLERRLTARAEELSELRRRHAGVAERISVLDDLQQRLEGVGAGVKEILLASRNNAAGPWRGVIGMVGDLLDVGVDVAPLVDIALGPVAQYLVVRGDSASLRQVQQASTRLAGRVGFLLFQGESTPPAMTKEPSRDNGVEEKEDSKHRIVGGPRYFGTASENVEVDEDAAEADERSTAAEPSLLPLLQSGRSRPTINFDGAPGVFGRADRSVETPAELRPLAKRLLGTTWIVESLEHAIRLATRAPGEASFVTFAGQFLSRDGSLVVGPRDAGAGVVSRRSELRALRFQHEQLGSQVRQLETNIESMRRALEDARRKTKSAEARRQDAFETLAVHRSTVDAKTQQLESLTAQRESLFEELRTTDQSRDEAAKKVVVLTETREQLGRELAAVETTLGQLKTEMQTLTLEQATLERDANDLKVEIAKSEERIRNDESTIRQFQRAREERAAGIAEGRQQLREYAGRIEHSRRSILQKESEIATLYLRKETLAERTRELIAARDESRRARERGLAEVKRVNGRLRQVEEKISAKRLTATQIENDRDALSERLREDYDIELAELHRAPTDEEIARREEVRREIEDLRRKINELGSINMEALAELEQTETRWRTMAEQYQDLVDAKAALEKLIDKINIDSQRLFQETFETVRGHFQTLFCDLFGGGHGDILLEEGEDPLECGIEVVARPPGKELRSISLLSGGEKTLTCVALLLAIFRSRPSPFCVLDEVDAALDEANIDRFTKVLQKFLAWTQFIIITHSKKTMICASTIYGVTMQESGVSKPVSVRFEDVSEDGHILPSPERDAA